MFILKNLLRQARLILFHVIFPLISGGIIYIAYRSKSLILFRWFDEIGISGFTNSIRDFLNHFKNHLPNWIIFSLPDGLWLYSFTSILLIIWEKDIEKIKFWLLIPFLAFSSYELLKILKILQGTFDLVDLFIYFLAFILSIINIELIPQVYAKKIN